MVVLISLALALDLRWIQRYPAPQLNHKTAGITVVSFIKKALVA